MKTQTLLLLLAGGAIGYYVYKNRQSAPNMLPPSDDPMPQVQDTSDVQDASDVLNNSNIDPYSFLNPNG